MTVTDRRGGRIAGQAISTSLGGLLADVRGNVAGRFVAASVSIDPIDAIDLFVTARSLGHEAALWLQPGADRSIVGVGRAWAAETGGPDRFEVGATAWRSLVADAVLTTSPPTTSGPILLGGLGFTGRTPAADDPWAPFGPASLVLPVFAVVRDGATTTLTISIVPDRDESPDPVKVEQLWATIAGMARARATARPAGGSPTTSAAAPDRLQITSERPDRAEWERTVGMFAGAVGRGRIDKVVLARRVAVKALDALDVETALRHLAMSAPESTTFAFARAGTTFVGATPERLARTSGRSFETVAIAGSAPRGADPAEDARFAAALLASEKDREEHAVVVETLRAGLMPIAETLHIADAPAILRLRHVQHLVTPITGELRDEAGLLALAARLHPTPAVGGAPREIALEMIAEHEGFDRGWYAGPVGWLGADGDGELMVALRCGLVTEAEAILFAGCGIVADSDPAREWVESQLKLRTMIRALGGSSEDGA